MSLRIISISELKPGMFITELDISWLNSPFLMKKKRIQSQNEIEVLVRSGAKKITIDLNQSDAACFEQETEEMTQLISEERDEKSNPAEAVKQPLSEVVKLAVELQEACKLKKEINQLGEKINCAIENNEPVNMQDITPIIDKTISSLCRNDQALTSLLRHSKSQGKLTSHTFNVFTLSLMLATKLKVSEEDQQLLGVASLLHDSGWARLPGNLFSKGKPYTSTEKKLTTEHIKIVLKILEQSSSVPNIVATIISQHHERCNGTGYPSSLTSTNIHPLTKIMMIADTYDEMMQGIGEQPGMISSLAISNLFKLAQQQQLDETMCKAFVSAVGIYPIGCAVKLNTGEKGIVIELNRDTPLNPIIKIYYNRLGNPMFKAHIVNLAKQDQAELKRKITSALNCNNKKDDPAQILSPQDFEIKTQ